MVDGKLIKFPISEEEYINQCFKLYGVEIVTPKEKLINALRQGDYVIGINYNPFELQDVFHYENGKIEILKVDEVGDVIPPLRLRRDLSILLRENKPSLLDAFFIEAMAHYDDFIVCRKGHLLDTESLSPSIADSIQAKLRSNQDNSL